jgi:hypothetical protein
MKHNKILRILGIALILSLLMTVSIAAPASAATTLLSPASGTIGTSITLIGSGFAATTSYYVYFSNQLATTGQSIGTQVTVFQTVSATNSDASGVINTAFPIPSAMTSTGSVAVTPAIYYIYVVVPTTNIIVAVSALTVIGNPAITLSPTTGTAETSVTITGSGFTPSSVLAFRFDTTTVSPTAGVTASSTTGAFSSTITVPTGTTAGAHTITVTAGTNTATATFTVTASASLDTLSPATGEAGTDVVITGSNFPVSTALVFKYDTTTLTRKSGDSATRTSGIFITTVTIPTNATAGAHTITATAGAINATATFTVTSSATLDELSPNSGRAGTDVTISGSHFTAGTTLVIKIDDVAITPKSGDTATIANGSFSTVITIPATATVTAHTISVTVGSNTESKTFTVTASPSSVNISANSDAIGSTLVIYGQSFLPGTAVTITYDGVTIGTRNTDASGYFISDPFKVPAGIHGNHTIIVTDGVNSKSSTFTVESTAPQIPTPLVPAMGASLKSPYLFDWADVTDVSAPVSYELQIATAADFSTNSIVLTKTALKESQYNLTEAEATPLSSGNGISYYWRERAIDAASNASGWTGAGQFNIPKPFDFVGWPLYLTMGVGAVVFFLLGLWLGRRSAFSY